MVRPTRLRHFCHISVANPASVKTAQKAPGSLSDHTDLNSTASKAPGSLGSRGTRCAPPRSLRSLVRCLRSRGSPSEPAPFIPTLPAGRGGAPLPAGRASAPLSAGQISAPLPAGRASAPLPAGQISAPLSAGRAERFTPAERAGAPGTRGRPHASPADSLVRVAHSLIPRTSWLAAADGPSFQSGRAGGTRASARRPHRGGQPEDVPQERVPGQTPGETGANPFWRWRRRFQ